MARWLLGSAVRCCTARWVCVAGVLGVPFGLVGQARVCGVALPGDCVLVPCPLVSLPRGECRVLWGRVSWSSPLPFCPSASLSSLVLGVAAVSPLRLRCPRGCICVVAPAVAGLVPWRSGCAGGLRAVLDGSFPKNFPKFLLNFFQNFFKNFFKNFSKIFSKIFSKNFFKFFSKIFPKFFPKVFPKIFPKFFPCFLKILFQNFF